MDNTIEKKPLEELLDTDTMDMINCMATKYATKYGRGAHCSMINHSDLVSEGYVGATVAYQAFDPSKPASFRTFAFPYIRNAMMSYCRRYSHTLSISERAARRDYGDITDIGVVHIDQFDDEDGEFDIPMGSGVEAGSVDIDEYFLVGFSELEAGLVKDHMLNGYSLQDLANKYGISKTSAGETLRGLKDRMRERATRYVEDN